MSNHKNYNHKITIFGQDCKAKETFIIKNETDREANRIAKSDPRVIEAGERFWSITQEREGE